MLLRPPPLFLNRNGAKVHVRSEALIDRVEVKDPSPLSCHSREGEAGDSPTTEVPGGWQAAPFCSRDMPAPSDGAGPARETERCMRGGTGV